MAEGIEKAMPDINDKLLENAQFLAACCTIVYMMMMMVRQVHQDLTDPKERERKTAAWSIGLVMLILALIYGGFYLYKKYKAS